MIKECPACYDDMRAASYPFCSDECRERFYSNASYQRIELLEQMLKKESEFKPRINRKNSYE